MKIQSAWARGVVYGAIVGILFFLAVLTVALIGNESIGNGLQTGAIGMAMWGGIGFLLGYFGHGETSPESVIRSTPQTRFFVVRRWIYRLLAGLALGHLAAALVELLDIAFVSVMYGGLDEFLKPRPRLPHEVRYVFLGLSVMIGSAMAAALGGFLGVMMAPWRYDSRLLIRSSAMAAALGSLAGAWVGGLVGVLYPKYLESDHVVILAISGGAVVGIASTIVLRLRVNR